jgi:hypothetical protein
MTANIVFSFVFDAMVSGARIRCEPAQGFLFSPGGFWDRPYVGGGLFQTKKGAGTGPRFDFEGYKRKSARIVKQISAFGSSARLPFTPALLYR